MKNNKYMTQSKNLLELMWNHPFISRSSPTSLWTPCSNCGPHFHKADSPPVLNGCCRVSMLGLWQFSPITAWSKCKMCELVPVLLFCPSTEVCSWLIILNISLGLAILFTQKSLQKTFMSHGYLLILGLLNHNICSWHSPFYRTNNPYSFCCGQRRWYNFLR